MKRLRQFPLVYLATPYTRYDGGMELAFRDACKVTARLILDRVFAYSPIAATHSIAAFGRINPLDLGVWLPYNRSMMLKSDALCVVKLLGWDESIGVTEEIVWFHQNKKPVLYLDAVSWQVTDSE